MKIDHDGLQLDAQKQAKFLLTLQKAEVLNLAIQLRQAAALERIAAALEDGNKKIGSRLA